MKKQEVYSVLILLLLSNQAIMSWAQLTINLQTPPLGNGNGNPNTFIGAMGSQIAGSLLASGTLALLWGVAPSSSINDACRLIVNNGTFKIHTTVTNEWGGRTEHLTLQIVATGGCLAASDGSGTEFVFMDNFRRKSAVVCPSNAGSIGCGVYITGSDIDYLHSAGSNNKRRLLSLPEGALGSHRNLLACSGKGAAIGGLIGLAGGALTALGCGFLTVFAPFCVAGVLGIEILLGALGGSGCLIHSSCFPGHASAQLMDGRLKPMAQLALGDKVAVVTPSSPNVITYEDVYAFGHKDPHSKTLFLQITLEQLSIGSHSTNKTLELTDLHFVPASSDANGKVYFKYAKDINVGDFMWATQKLNHSSDHQPIVPHRVASISATVKSGLYNPLTLGGTILVDGVLASAHSDWFLDETFDAMGLPQSWLPHVYQLTLLPVRFLYSFVGTDFYANAYNWLDNHVDLAVQGALYGGIFSCAVIASSILAIHATISYFHVKKSHGN